MTLLDYLQSTHQYFSGNINMNATERLTAYLAAALKPNLSANAWSQAAWDYFASCCGIGDDSQRLG
jgi:hypothetical protein